MAAPESLSAEGPRLGTFRFTRSETQIAELRKVCRLWQAGPERFWSFDDVLAALSRSGSVGFYASVAVDGPWQGVIFADVGPFSADLLYVYVLPEARQSGAGRLLVRQLVAELASRPQIEALFLEVRAGNVAAQRLYTSLGMSEVGRRKAYYADGEDALVFRYGLLGKDAAQ